MPSQTHEVLVSLFRDCPALGLALMQRGTGVTMADSVIARQTAAEFTDLRPAEYRADVVIRLERDDAKDGDPPAGMIIVEVQLERDGDKLYSWPMYEASARARLRCPTTLLVITLDPSVASWCRKPIVLGPSGSASRPVVLGPHQLPRIDDEETARQLPELAVLTAAAHSENADSAEAVATALTVCEELDRERAAVYADLLLSRLSKAAAHALEAVMETRKYSYQSEFARKYFGQGLAKGREEGLAEGREEGLAEGREEGLAEGREEGLAEGREEGLRAMLR
ncbi:MAG: hypothetical protein AAGC55_20450, partial [Myxococcota bacterium]